MLKKLYNWVLGWADTPYATPALFLLALSESSFFPIPPDPLLIVLCISIPARSFRYAFICSIASVLGGAIGYLIGMEAWDLIGEPIIELYEAREAYDRVAKLYQRYDAIAVGIAGFTPIPYKLFTIAAGVCKVNFAIFLMASLASRSARFFILAILVFFFGDRIKLFLEKYFNILTILFVILLVGGFLLLKYIL